jgi:hypothetical protein
VPAIVTVALYNVSIANAQANMECSFDSNRPYNTNVGLFDQMMKYLYENHFKVLTYKQLQYNTQTNTFYLNQTNTANPTKFYSIDVTDTNKIVPKLQ